MAKTLADFKDFLSIDKQLKDRTVDRHLYEIKRHLRALKIDPRFAERKTVRDYLIQFKDAPANTYANVLKSLKVFYRDYLGKGHTVESFKFPYTPDPVIIAPPKEHLQKFYYRLKEPMAQALFFVYATAALRRKEALKLRIGDVDFKRRMIIPKERQRHSRTKRLPVVTFYNEEAEKVLEEHLSTLKDFDNNSRLFPVTETYFRKRHKKIERETGIRISPQILREWFCNEMGELDVPDRYIDAFCGRVPKSVLAKHYTDYSPKRLKRIYDKAGLRVLS